VSVEGSLANAEGKAQRYRAMDCRFFISNSRQTYLLSSTVANLGNSGHSLSQRDRQLWPMSRSSRIAGERRVNPR